MASIAQRFRELPRAGKWLVGLVAFLVLYFGVVEQAIGFHNSMSIKAERLESQVEQAMARASGDDDTSKTLSIALTRFGEVELSDDPSAASAALVAEVGRVLKEAELDSETTTRSSAMSRNVLSSVLRVGEVVDRQIAEVRFTTTPAQAVEIVSKLESSPLVTGISRVSMQQLANDRGLVRVTVVCETWAIQRSGGSA
ncbi:MAG: hypothetical protein AAGB34_05055 [Planctomycetota bacterium]